MQRSSRGVGARQNQLACTSGVTKSGEGGTESETTALQRRQGDVAGIVGRRAVEDGKTTDRPCGSEQRELVDTHGHAGTGMSHRCSDGKQHVDGGFGVVVMTMATMAMIIRSMYEGGGGRAAVNECPHPLATHS